jgi:TRAP-type C4-dicarboxylate transport system permease small subunit
MREPAGLHGGPELPSPIAAPDRGGGALDAASRLLSWLEARIFGVSMLALLGAAVILTAGVFLRYFLKIPTDWQDEAAVFLIVGATFLCGGAVQASRGHVGIAALASALPPRWNRLRVLLCDAVSLLFCAFFAWKSWKLLGEAMAEHQTTSSSWGPPLWIPYGLMAGGMTLLAARLLLQLALGLSTVHPLAPRHRGEGGEGRTR